MEKNIVELRTLRKERRGYMQYIFSLRARGVIGAYVSENGYAAYCPEEVEAFQKKTRRGRPLVHREAERKGKIVPDGYFETRVMLDNLMAEMAREKKEK